MGYSQQLDSHQYIRLLTSTGKYVTASVDTPNWTLTYSLTDRNSRHSQTRGLSSRLDARYTKITHSQAHSFYWKFQMGAVMLVTLY